jgi:tetratricopeptide (TPR) repeat protein
MQDWMANQSEMSLYYLGSEWREYDEERAMQYLRQFITINRSNGPMRYNTRLILCKMLGNLGRLNEAREVLLPAVGDDWSRTEHWVWLGDILFEQERYDEALQFYLYGSTKIGEPPFTLWWIDLAFYSYIPAQRLAMCYSALGQLDSALQWAKNAKDLLPEDAPEELVQEHITNIKTLEEALSNGLS